MIQSNTKQMALELNRYFNICFYTLKPAIPRTLQIMLRRWIGNYKRKKYSHIWPINPSTSLSPAGWPGWPGGKKFAVLLSHDVETRRGYRRVLDLAKVEETLGFRSVFNFVPEAYGKISKEVIGKLRDRGFGIGVHGLKHDGKLFLSKSVFDDRAPKINSYLKSWESKGFSSPSMHHNLEWMESLNIDYSISTFDTDPFEPQPDASGTIFPIWIFDKSRDRGIVELSLTMPQDFTLFIILKEKTNRIWKQKLDWIASKGGMVILNTHPDYMIFNGRYKTKNRYPISLYKDFLNYLSDRYAGQFYHAKPMEVATFYAQHQMQH